MPLFREWTTDNDSLAAIWKIEEPEEFFTKHTGLTTDIKNEKRRLEHLTARYLLKHLKADFPLMGIKKDAYDKPRIDDDKYFFSISHSWPYVAVMINEDEEVGIDIETWHPRIHEIQSKFLGPDEQALCEDKRELITLAWSAKEAAFKWAGRAGVDFKEHLPISYLAISGEYYNINILCTLTSPNQMISLQGLLDPDFSCVYVIAAQDWAIY